MKDDISTSGIIKVAFISAEESQTSYEPINSYGFNQLVKVKRQGRWFLLKGLKPEFRQNPVYLELLKKEYALMAQLDHPNIVKAYAKEENEILGPCIVMEYIDGVTLDIFLSGNPSKDVRRKVTDQIVDALCHVHSKQILHRDLKPGNILITRNGNNVKIIDFGLSDADDYAILKQSAGTLKYMAPEQLEQGRKIDCRADIFAFGLLLKRLFPHRFRRIAARCTRDDSERRYADMEAVRRAFEKRDRRRRLIPFLAVLLLAMIGFLLLAIRPYQQGTASESLSAGMSADQKNHLSEAEWFIDTILQPISMEARHGNEYREVLLAKLTKHSSAIKSMCNEMSCIYPSGSPEWMSFVSQIGNIQQREEKEVMDLINVHCRSFREDFQKQKISQTAYDSLVWLISSAVMTLPVMDIAATEAVGGVEIHEKGYCGGMELGICWSMLHNPTINGRHACCNRGEGKAVMSGLMPNTTYFVRAYLSGSAGVTYGNEMSFTTLQSDSVFTLQEGALPGLFSLSENKQVLFSKGNLQYQASTDTWRFASHQHEYIGKDNEKISETYSGWIDLFGWATSGYDHGAVNYHPWSGNKDTQSNALHWAYGDVAYDLFDQTGKADWGYNAISNGGNQENQWRTPRLEEWSYLLFVRPTASGIRFAKGQVDGVDGLIVLPDHWKVTTYQLNSVNMVESYCNSNVISLSDWQQFMEPAGAVFLPMAGARTISGVFIDAGFCQTSTAGAEDSFEVVFYNSNLVFLADGHRGDGLSVRLVHDVE